MFSEKFFAASNLPAALLLMSFFAMACAPAASGYSSSQRMERIRALEQAREQDLANAHDGSLGPTAVGEYMIQADKANEAIADLYRSGDVSQSEIADALFVPPKHLSDAERVQLIRQLEQSRDLDELQWRHHQGGREPILEEDYAVQERKAKRVIADLENKTPVSWAEINDAMQVPTNLY